MLIKLLILWPFLLAGFVFSIIRTWFVLGIRLHLACVEIENEPQHSFKVFWRN